MQTVQQPDITTGLTSPKAPILRPLHDLQHATALLDGLRHQLDAADVSYNLNGMFERGRAVAQLSIAMMALSELPEDAGKQTSCYRLLWLNDPTAQSVESAGRQLEIRYMPNGLSGEVLYRDKRCGMAIVILEMDGLVARESGVFVHYRV